MSSIKMKAGNSSLPCIRLLKAKLDNSGNYLQPSSVLDFSQRETRLLCKLTHLLCGDTMESTSHTLEFGWGKGEGKRTCHWNLTVHSCFRKKKTRSK